MNFICLAVSDTETEPSSGAISVQPKAESNPLLQKVAAIALKVSPTLAVALSFCLRNPLVAPPPLSLLYSASDGCVEWSDVTAASEKCGFRWTALNIHTTEGEVCILDC